MDPWCVVELVAGGSVLFGYAIRHAATGGLSWTCSTPIVELDADGGHARTMSGRRYRLGRRIDIGDIPDEGEEAWLAFAVLIGANAADGDAVPPVSADPAREGMWLAACKMARHLRVAPPGRAPKELDVFIGKYLEAYLDLRKAMTRRQ